MKGGDKMNKKACYYTVVKYLPDPVRNEPRNIGLILQSRELDYVNCKYVSNLQAKLGSTATKLDIKVIRAYIEEFLENFNPFAKFPSTKSFLPGRPNEFLREDYLGNLAKQGLGKIQFSEPRGCLSDNPEKELEYLFKTFVADEIAKEEVLKHSRLKTEVKQEFKKNKLLVLPQEREKKKGFEIDTKIPGGRSKVEHLVDFVFRNGKLYLVETVDFRKKDWASETFEAAVKFDDLKHGLGEDRIDPYSIVALPGNDGVEDYLKILTSYSKVFHYTTEKEKKEFIYEMKELVSSEANLFRKK